ncbi:hypothetical protein [Haloarcula laminariae]|nr:MULTISPECIES: hypothetical protein [Halomicroarcula]
MGDSDTDDSFPWFLKVIIGVALLVVLFIIGVDLLTFIAAW